MKLLLSGILFAFCFTSVSYAQYKHIKYETELFLIETGSSIKVLEYLYKTIDEAEYNIILLDKNKCLVYEYYEEMLNKKEDEPKSQKLITAKVFDKKKKSFSFINLYYDYNTNIIRLGNFSKIGWQNISEYQKKLEGDTFLKSIISTSISEPKNCNPKIIKTGIIEEVNNFKCERIIYEDCYEKKELWVTNEVIYNWAFNDYKYSIKGTVIKEKGIDEDITHFDFLEIKDLDYSDIIFSKEILEEILSRW